MSTPPHRDYSDMRLSIPDGALRAHLMRIVVDALWDSFQWRTEGDLGFSWVGFYVAPGQAHGEGTVGDDEMILAVREPKPACSPIGLHGACGRCFIEWRAVVVSDVKNLGENYVACDPRDRSEVVVPCLDDSGACFAVLDVDSFDVGAFTEADAAGLVQLLVRAGLTVPRREPSGALVY